uniref:F-box domain-containing protein n=1 Tax=Graphocephala atropunctata TaxID=36148 RepID=A0A1B6MT61_9HEMI
MDSLPVEVVEIIAQYLTAKDLAACCAISRAWRDMFGQDIIWKAHCNRAVAKYLATAESRVEPRFVTPESKDEENSLSPLGDWRLAYLREQLLWNHWKEAKFDMKLLKVNDPSNQDLIVLDVNDLCVFVTDDYLIISKEKQVMLWNVRNIPVYVSDPFRLLLSGGVIFYSTFNNNKIVVVQKTVVQIYNFGSPLKQNWILESSFYFDRPEAIPFRQSEVFESYPLTFGCLIIDNCFVGVLASGEVHVWNLISGIKLKKVKHPFNSCDEVMKVVESEKLLKDFVIVFRRNAVYHFYVLCMASLDYYPFTTSQENQMYPSCVIQSGLLAICSDFYFKIFDYRTSQLVLIVPAEYTVGVLSLDNHFLLIAKNTVHIFHTVTSAFESVLLALINPFEDINGFNDIRCGKFLITFHMSGDVTWEIDLKSKPTKITHLQNSLYSFSPTINKACTKVAQRSWDIGVEITSFW